MRSTDLSEVLVAHPLVVVGECTDEYGGIAATHVLERQACIFQRLVGGLQQDALLWIHGMGLLRWYLKETGVELGYVVLQEVPVLGRQGFSGSLLGVVERITVPTISRNWPPARNTI